MLHFSPRRFRVAVGVALSTVFLTAPAASGASISIAQVSVGDEGTCAVSTTHVAYCWGHGNSGLIGNGLYQSTLRPAKVKLTGVSSIAVGARSACATTTSSKLYCWGDNGDFELARTLPTTSATPLLVSGITGAKKVVIGEAHVCVLLTSGTIKCWGLNTYGQLGNGTVQSTPTPTLVTGVTSAVDLVAGSAHTCAVLRSTSVWCWGWDGYDQVFSGTADNEPHPLPVALSLATYGTVASFGSSGTSQHVCGLTTAKRVLCWGYNVTGAVLPFSSNNNKLTNINLLTGTGTVNTATSVSTGIYHTCLVNSSGELYCQGLNDVGQIGQFPTGQNGAGLVTLSQRARSVAVGQDVSCVILQTGKLQCFGDNSRGQLGNGTIQNSWAPVNVVF